jgi:uncharacterized protein YndB with AHSA1/START domain
MSGKWQRTFEIAVPVERVWQAFTDPEELKRIYSPRPAADGTPLDDDSPAPGTQVLEVVPLQKLRFAQDRDDLPEKAEFEIVFESTDNGSRIHVTRCGFGEGELTDIFSESNALGWGHGFMDLVLYLETGQLVKRHYYGAGRSRMGMAYADTDSGLIVRQVLDDGFAAEVGLSAGDKLVRIGGAAVYQRSDVWMINSLFEPGTELEVEYIRDAELRFGAGKLSTQEIWAVGE